VIGLSVLSARLVQIQLVDRQRYAASSRKAFHRVERLPAIRGMIVDRKEEPLAKSVPVSTVFVDKNHLYDPKIASYGLAYLEASSEDTWSALDAGAKKRRVSALRGEILSRDSAEQIVKKHLDYAVGIMARPLGMRKDDLRKSIETSRGKWVPVAKDLPEDVADNLRDMVDKNLIQGFEFQNSIKRWYTTPDRATHVLGYTGEIETIDEEGKPETRVVGRFGIEKTMEEYLAGSDGWREHTRDARGLLLPGDAASLMPPRSGLNVKLTIDMGLQSIVEEELDAGLKEFESQRGAVVMLDPKTGEILAMACRPDFDLNRKLNVVENGYNYAIQAIYEPGSTIKIVAASGALNEGLVTPATSINCHNGYFKNGQVEMRDSHPAGYLTYEQVLQKSNNNGTYQLALKLGSKRFYDYLQRFGFGRKTGIQLSGESAGRAKNTNNEVDFSRACFGYATNVTPLQLACAYGAVASDGKLRKPMVVKSLIANDGTVVESFEPKVVNQVISEKTAYKVRQALKKVVEVGGTATLAKVVGFDTAGKTGTVQKINPAGGYYADKYIVSFVGMMPADDPAFVCLVVIDDPRTKKCNIYGGSIAGPVFSRIATRAATYMNLQPTGPVSMNVAATNH
jgi:cell division protein FtsI/penicillin-binding protein 2